MVLTIYGKTILLFLRKATKNTRSHLVLNTGGRLSLVLALVAIINIFLLHFLQVGLQLWTGEILILGARFNGTIITTQAVTQTHVPQA